LKNPDEKKEQLFTRALVLKYIDPAWRGFLISYFQEKVGALQ